MHILADRGVDRHTQTHTAVRPVLLKAQTEPALTAEIPDTAPHAKGSDTYPALQFMGSSCTKPKSDTKRPFTDSEPTTIALESAGGSHPSFAGKIKVMPMSIFEAQVYTLVLA